MTSDPRKLARAEDAMRRSERLFRTFFESTPVMMHTLNDRWELVSVNDHWLRVLGYERQEVLGHRVTEFMTEASRQEAREVNFPRFLEAGVSRDVEVQFIKKDGEVLDVLLSAIAERDATGRIDYTLAFLIDISDRKRAEVALQRSEARFRKLVEHAADAFFVIDPEGRVLDVNQLACESLGCSRDELLGMAVSDFAQPSRGEVASVLERLRPDEPLTIEGTHRRKDGSRFPVEVRIGLLEESGCRLYVALARDTTERKAAEAALRESEERFAAIFRSAMDAIVIVDADLRIRMFNEAAERVFKCPAGEAENKPLTDLLTFGSRATLSRCLKSFEMTEAKHCYLWAPEGLSARRADGEEFPVEATVSVVEVGEQQLYAIILRDIDDRKRAEAELHRLQEEKIYLEQELETVRSVGEIVGTSPAMAAVFDAIEKVAATDSTVLITGETGTGKALVARAIHNSSSRRDKVLVTVNCAALPGGLIESELFGHEKGAFTGATSRKIGRFELANRGTVFLDEIGDFPLDLQTKLLRVLQDGEFERVGGSQTRKVDVRVIAATNRDLPEAIDKGNFRSDLFYRLNVFPIHAPPLRDRKGDIPLLVRHMVMKYSVKLGKKIESIPQAAMNALTAYDWPGNVRELENVIERAVILTGGRELEPGDWLLASVGPSPSRVPTLAELERDHIVRVLEATGWRVRGEGGAAALLGLKPTTLEARMKKLEIERKR
ncbi:MAG: sigma 54-interacting transcriptional regulator [Gemmatimonadota bacterium]|nr:MAG: sigma 54-interacting transcriptional regulator [Gemmatimonadota bacterium]